MFSSCGLLIRLLLLSITVGSANSMSPTLVALLVLQQAAFTSAQTAITNDNIKEAATAWVAGDTATYGSIIDWVTSDVVDMKELFYNAAEFNDDISNWDTSKVTDMEYMFCGASVFNQELDSWDTSKVTNLYGTFYDSAFNQKITSWDTSSVSKMGGTFGGTSEFSQDLSCWDVTNVITCDGFGNSLGSNPEYFETIEFTTTHFSSAFVGCASNWAPCVTEAPTAAPTAVPTAAPTAVPTAAPTAVPTDAPTVVATDAPTAVPFDAGQSAVPNVISLLAAATALTMAF